MEEGNGWHYRRNVEKIRRESFVLQQKAKTFTYFILISLGLVSVFLVTQNFIADRPLFSLINGCVGMILVLLLVALALLASAFTPRRRTPR